MELVTGKKIKTLRSDNGTEYKGPFTNNLEIWGIQPQMSNVYTPQQNGVSERLNRTLFDCVRAMLYDDGDNKPDKQLWGEAVIAVNYLKNRLPSRVIGMKTPHEMLFGKPADISHLRV